MEKRFISIIEWNLVTLVRILIIEDDNNKFALIKDVLIEEGVSSGFIDRARFVNEALNKLSLNTYDLVVLDLNLPLKKPNGKKVEDAGVTILDEFEHDNTLIAPGSIMGLTSFKNLQDTYEERFSFEDFNLYTTDNDTWISVLKRKLRWTLRSKEPTIRIPNKKIVVTVHGIRTIGVWQENLASHLNLLGSEFIAKSFRYRNLSALRLMNKKVRDRVAHSFSLHLDKLIIKYPDAEFYFFAHSFGTYLLANKLKELSHANAPKIKSIVLAGSVLRRDFAWASVKHDLNVENIVNDCGIDDFALVASQLLIPQFGAAGRFGFYTFEDEVVSNREHIGGHSFFEKNHGFYEKYWLPLLTDNQVVEPPKCNRSWLVSFTDNFLENAKVYTILLLIFLVIFLVIEN